MHWTWCFAPISSAEPLTRSTVPPSPTATAGIFCTYPQQFLGKTNQFFSEFITATLLMFVIFALKDESNRGAMGKTGAGPFFRRLFNPFTFFRWAAHVQDHSPRTVFPDIRARRVFWMGDWICDQSCTRLWTSIDVM